MGNDEYKKDIMAAASLLTTYKTPTNQRPQQTTNLGGQLHAAATPEASALAFAQHSTMTNTQQVAASVAGTNGVLHPGMHAQRPVAAPALPAQLLHKHQATGQQQPPQHLRNTLTCLVCNMRTSRKRS